MILADEAVILPAQARRAREPHTASRGRLAGVAFAGAVVIASATALVLFAHGFQPHGQAGTVGQVVVDGIWIATGLIAWTRRPGNLVGPLMTAAGFADVAPQLYWHAALPFTVAQLASAVFVPVFVHLLLAFPSGRLPGRLERRLVAFTYAAAVLLSPIFQLFWDPRGTDCPRCPRNLLLVDDDHAVWNALHVAGSLILLAVLLTTAVLLVRRLSTATRPTRRAFAPVLVAAVTAVVLLLAAVAVDTAGGGGRVLAAIAGVAWAAIPVAFLVGVLRTRLHRSAVAALVVELGSSLPPGGVRDAIARTLGDPSLELGFWLPEYERYVDADGSALSLGEQPGRAVTVLVHDGRRLAAIVHDPALLDERELLEAVGAAAGLTLENARLQAELRARLAELRASRMRIVAAGDAERRRLERDLHDGAQQRLLGIRLALKLARGRVQDGRAVEALLAEVDAEVVDALSELRALARGIHPAILIEQGLGPALAALVRRAPAPVELAVCSERLPASVEATAYFVAAEALANVVKHADASRVTIGVSRTNGSLAIDVADDGRGGADPGGAGLCGLRDRVEALDGRLRVESPPEGGTRVTAAIPCV